MIYSKRSVVVEVLLPLTFSLGAAVAVLALGSDEPISALSAFFSGPFRNTYSFGNMLDSASYLILTALGVSIAFASGGFNLGGEGQMYAGAFTGGMILLLLPEVLGGWGVLLGIGAAAIVGGVLAALSSWFKRSLGVSELISSYLVSLGIIPVIDGLLSGPLRDPSKNLLSAPSIARAFHLPRILPPSSLNIGIFLALGVALSVWFFLHGSKRGYEFRVAGGGSVVARLAGIATGLYGFWGFTVSGVLHGFAGGLAVAGTYHAAMAGVTSGMGWNGIAAALIGRNHPLGVILGALFFAYLQAAARSAMLVSDFSTELSGIVQALIFLLITLDYTTRRRRGGIHG
ncbi:ABC transporter permease [Spirochaeta lutea]|uniref:ABC transporter permease n=1 Tax=Spirochaeta lutea TaxID=1480694 RepID=A0A098R2F5_9SPIO|nr:ABC transporter permease [Spirochaeta lutea]KGE73813.1 hypothetical protein DC28_00920 [Spirochaeta lutea]